MKNFIFAMITLITSTTVYAGALPPEIADCKVFKIWQFDKSPEEWLPDHNVSKFVVSDGILSFTNIGTDPWIINQKISGMNTAHYQFIGIKMRSSVSGCNQVYFGTDTSPTPSEEKVLSQEVIGDGEFHFYELDMSKLKTWTGRLKTLRIDPANSSKEIGAQIAIDWIALYQVPARITIGRPYAYMDSGEMLVSLPIANTGGETTGPNLVVRGNNTESHPGALSPHETKTVQLRINPPGTANISVILKGKIAVRISLSPPIDTKSNIPEDKNIELQNIGGKLTFSQTRPINSVRLTCMSGNGPSGVFYPLAVLAYKHQGVMHYMEINGESLEKRDEHTVIMRATRRIGTGTVSFEWTFSMPESSSEGSIICELRPTIPVEVLRFEGPRLLAGNTTAKEHAIFPGLEYLDKNEPSSSVEHIGPKYADRHIPHPYKVTVPVMAVETDGGIIGLAWSPLHKWATGESLPCAEFESPNKSLGANNHLMTLFAPSIPTYVDENAEYAKRPYQLKPNETMRLSAFFFARPQQTITDVIPNYYAAHGLPKPPPITHGVEETIALCLKAYTETLFYPDKNGWKNHVGLRQTPTFTPHFAALVLGESLRRGEPALAAKCQLPPDAQIAQYIGTTMDWFSEAAQKNVEAVIAQQSPDGSFSYELTQNITDKLKELSSVSGCDAETLGTIGATNSGLIARKLDSLLDHALKTSRKEWIEAGLKGIAKMNTFTVPRGAQTWEVHMHTPDIYAAGLQVDANLKGYQLTGDEKYLDAAKFWAYTGLPFIYSWSPPIETLPNAVVHMDEYGEGTKLLHSNPSEFYEEPHRHINPGATIPVFGTSFYLVSWFGIPVQWCGQSWADSVRRYLAVRKDEVLETAADMVFASATQQQLEKGFLAGLYPDSWNLFGNMANGPFICPDRIIDYAYMMIGEQAGGRVNSIGFNLGTSRCFLSAPAIIAECKTADSTMEATLKFYAGQDLYTCIAHCERPKAVSMDSKTLSESANLKAYSSGWYYDEANRALHIKYRPETRLTTLRAEW